ncbi:tetratricopeptide repeat-containing sensor histidine kinase [Aquimarina pacifica]|uniref:tetratricopeptide repeat-containing sensor histidine kinase n=1 Tax=Aquimarina pacifica TaxID=1296415 RepID=UPI0004702059|nr:sensor histidine kinase [Aquimarina pacifica]
MIVKIHILVLLILLSNITIAQKDSLIDSFIHYNQKEQYSKIVDYWESNQFGKTNEQSLILIEVAIAYENLNKEDVAFIYYQKALKIFIESKNQDKIIELNLRIYKLLDSQLKIEIDKEIYFKEFERLALKSNTPKWLAELYHIYAVRNFENKDFKIPKGHFLKALKNFKLTKNNKKRIAATYANIGLLLLNTSEQLDSARHYLQKGLKISTQENDKNTSWNIYLSIGNSYKMDKEYHKAISAYLKADSLNIKKYALNKKRILYFLIQECYAKTGDYKKSHFYLDQYDIIKDSINLTKQNTNISEIKERYNNEKLRADNLQIESQRIQNRNLFIGSLILLIFGVITAFLLHKNTKRKQRIAEQERELQVQKTEKLLKDQELSAIDAMISGQEKERQRLANDLHDNLGSTLATVKLHFEHLKNNRENPKVKNIEELYTKTNTLLDEAYQKVRTIAHEKNSGVMANQGLLPAIKNLAKKISNRDDLKIEVQDFGLEERLDNTLEISIFRIIQELITNAIKHAKASEIIISLTNHDSLLNIIVEDNGKGFDAQKLPEKEGMGLKSIEKRIEHLEGTFEIDSTLGKGTNILMNIPI